MRTNSLPKFKIYLYFFLVTIFPCNAQEKPMVEGGISLLQSGITAEHPYFADFSQKDEAYITWLYAACRDAQKDRKQKKTFLLTATGKTDGPLVFQVRKANQVRLDTLRNCVHPKKMDLSNNGSKNSSLPLYGKLPEGLWSSLEHRSKGSTSIGFLVKKEKMDISAAIYDENKLLVHTLFDGILKQGSHSFKWSPKNNKDGRYLLVIRSQNQEMAYLLEVTQSFWRWMFG